MVLLILECSKDTHLGSPTCHRELLLSHFPQSGRPYLHQGWQGKDKKVSWKIKRMNNPGVDVHLLSQHGHEEPDVLRCPHPRRDEADLPKHPQCLLARPLRWTFRPWPVLPATGPGDYDPGRPLSAPLHPLHPLRPHHPLRDSPQRVQRQEGNEGYRPRNPLHIPNLHQSVFQLQIRHPGWQDTKKYGIRTASSTKITFNSQPFQFENQGSTKEKVFYFNISRKKLSGQKYS